MYFGIVNHAKLCVFFFLVLMCLKVVIEDQVKDQAIVVSKVHINKGYTNVGLKTCPNIIKSTWDGTKIITDF